jgi:hypothetical protein
MFLALLLSLRASDLFDAETKDNHPRVLFPAYYALEFPTLALAAVAGLVARCAPRKATPGFQESTHPPLPRWPVILTLAALGIAITDYVVVYRPLAEMLGRPPYPARFQTLHESSRWLNTAILLLTATAAVLSLWFRENAEESIES